MTGSQRANADQHVQLQLGLYVLGALLPADDRAVEQHLAQCEQCSVECAELSEVPPFLSLLSPADVDELAREFPPRPRAEDATTRDRPGGPSRPETPTPPAGPGRPGRPARNRTRGGGPRRGRLLLSAIALALVLGVGIGVWLTRTGPEAITLAGSETNAVTGVTMSVTVVGHDQQSHVDASVKGLRPGGEYEFYAVDRRGQTSVVARWVADAAAYTYSGDLQVPTGDLAFFTVTQTDGAVVVTVRVARSGPS